MVAATCAAVLRDCERIAQKRDKRLDFSRPAELAVLPLPDQRRCQLIGCIRKGDHLLEELTARVPVVTFHGPQLAHQRSPLALDGRRCVPVRLSESDVHVWRGRSTSKFNTMRTVRIRYAMSMFHM